MLPNAPYWTLRNHYSPPLHRWLTVATEGADASHVAEPLVQPAESTAKGGVPTGRDGRLDGY